MDLAQTYNRIAEDWHRDHQSDDWWVGGTDEFTSRLPVGGSVLDVGCGSGVKSAYLLERGFKITGIDISDNLLAIARTVAPAAEFRNLSMTYLGGLPETFDGIFAQASLLHIPKTEVPSVITKFVEHATPRGLIYLAVKERCEGGPEEEVKEEDDLGYTYERFFSYFTMLELESYLANVGVKVVWKDRAPSGKTVWLQIIGQK